MEGKCRRVLRRSAVVALFVSLFVPASGYPSDNVTWTLFGPESFSRSSGVALRNFNVPSTQGTFTLRLKNGDDAGNNKVSSATVKVNGATIVRSSDFNQQVVWIIKPLTNLVAGSNTRSVEVSNKSSTSSFVTITITGDYLLNITITSPAAGAEILSDRVDVSGTYVSYTSAVSVSVNGIAASSGGSTFTASNVPLASGSNTITAFNTTADGIQDNDSITVSANKPPVANAGQDQIVTVGLPAYLDGRNSYDPEGALITYSWSFSQRPAGSSAALDNPASVMPSYVPDLEGAYVLSLVVNDSRSNSPPDNVTLTAERPNVAPTASAGPDQSVVTGSLVTLDGSGSFDPDGDLLNYSWQFLSLPAGSQTTLNYPLTVNPNFLADVDGQYIVGLTVFDGRVFSLPDNVVVVAATPNAPPVANAGADNTVWRNALIRLDGTQSYDPDNNVLAYAWSIVSKPAGSVSELDNAASPTPAIPADAEGEYVFRLVVNDGRVDSAPDTVVIASVNAVPVADAGPDQSVPRNTALTLDGGGSHDANGDPLTYLWSVLSAPAGSAAAIGNPSAVNPLFTPDLAGQYLIRLVVNDGRVDSAPDNVTITAAPLSVTVPNVAGMAQADAQSAVVAAGLAVGAVSNANSDTVPAGIVISQNPAGGSVVPEESAVDLLVSLGPLMVTVPNVTGMTQTEAQTVLVAANLVVGAVTQANSATVPAGSVISQNPAGGSSVIHGSAVDLVVSLGPVMVTVPDLFGKPQVFAEAALSAAGLVTGTVTSAASETVIPGGVASQSPAAGGSVPQGSAVNIAISSGPAPVTIPPDPATVAPPVDPTVATDLYSATSFLYTGANPIQTGVAPGTIELKRAAVIRGRVLAADNTFLPGVRITILNHSEFGQTISRDDGRFDMAVNGAGTLIVRYQRGGFLAVQRQVAVPWQGFVKIQEVVMVPYDNQVTAVDLVSAIPVQAAQGSVATDADGTRRATLLFSQGTQATLVFADNSTRAITSLSVRATEYSVGPNGPNAMPAELPPTSAYTYCVEFSVDEAVSGGAAEVRFDRAIIHYVENFLNFPV